MNDYLVAVELCTSKVAMAVADRTGRAFLLHMKL